MLLYKDEYECWLENAVEDDLNPLLRADEPGRDRRFVLQKSVFWNRRAPGNDWRRDKPDERLYRWESIPGTG